MKTILITGISRGIGRALARKYLNDGWNVIGTSTTGKTDYFDNNLHVYTIDLSSSESIERCTEQIIDSGSKIDILIKMRVYWLMTKIAN